MPAHSQYVAFHSHFVQRLIHDLGPISWKEPLVVDTALKGHSRAAVDMLLAAVYQPGVVHLSNAQEAWQMYKLADHLDCPGMLQQCQEHINSSSGAALLSTASAAALEWLIAAHELGWDGLKQQCADSIAKNHLTLKADARMMQLPTELSMMIMQRMAEQHSKSATDIIPRLLTRSGRAMCVSKSVSGSFMMKAIYRFLCPKVECPGHEVKLERQRHEASLEGSYQCDEEPLQKIAQLSSRCQALDLEVLALLPLSLRSTLMAGCEYASIGKHGDFELHLESCRHPSI